MGRVIDLQAWRARREGRPLQTVLVTLPAPGVEVARLDRAVRRIERLMKAGTGRISARVETELLAITGAISAGRTQEAITRAERLVERLEHPSSRLSS